MTTSETKLANQSPQAAASRGSGAHKTADDTAGPAGADADTPLPGSFLTPRQVGWLKVAIVAMGVAIIALLAAMLIKILTGDRGASRAPRPAPVNTAASATTSSPRPDTARIRSLYLNQEKLLYTEGLIPVEARILSSHVVGERLVLLLEDAGGALILNFDLATWQVTGVARLDRQATAGSGQ